MKLTIFNGSPRNKKSNSKILIEHFLEGIHVVSSEEIPVYFLANAAKMEEHVKEFEMADTIIIVFPLYCDSMPGLVKEFFERISLLKKNQGKRVGFIVQSGFPEAIHSIFVEQYLIKFAHRMGFVYIGTVIKGGVEGIQIMPPMMTRKLFEGFKKLGEHFANSGEFSHEVITSLINPLDFQNRAFSFFGLDPN